MKLRSISSTILCFAVAACEGAEGLPPDARPAGDAAAVIDAAPLPDAVEPPDAAPTADAAEDPSDAAPAGSR